MSDTKQAMSIPGAIVIAGVLIAGAVYFSQVGPREAVAPTTDPNAAPSPRPASLDVRPISSEDHIRGPENAKITILEYSDLECPFCATFHLSMKQVMQKYPDDVRWVFRHAPIPQLHPNAPAFANAAECASDQGKFWEFTDAVFASYAATGPAVLTDIPGFATTAGVTDMSAFETCVKDNTFADKVEADTEDGMKAGPESFGTPFNLIIMADGKKTQLGGGVSFERLQAIIDPLL